MFQLFKQRDFGDYVNDTFQFFKQTGKHYMQNYFTISGIMLLLMAAITYIISTFYVDFLLRTSQFKGNPEEVNEFMIENFTSDNFSTLLQVGGVLFLVLVFLHMLNYSIPVIYLNLFEKNNGINFEFQDILKEFKSKFGKVFVFFLATFFLITPFLMIIFAVFFLLAFLLIGIPLLLFGIPAAYCWITLSFYEYLNTDKGYFEALGAGWSHLRKQFFPVVGSAMILFLMIQISVTAVTLIPSLFGMASFFTSLENPAQSGDALSSTKIILSVTMVISQLLSFVLTNLLLINQGLVYYSHREVDENKNAVDSIDWIGRE